MKAVVLIAGYGKRFKETKNISSKGLLVLYDKPIICHSVEMLEKEGIKDIAIVTSTQALESIKKCLGDGYTYIVQERQEGIPDAIRLAKDFVGDNKFIVLIGDSYFEGGVGEFIKEFDKSENDAEILVSWDKWANQYGMVYFEGGVIDYIVEKPRFNQEKLSGYYLTGIYGFTNKVFEYLDVDRKFLNRSWISSVLNEMNKNERIGFTPYLDEYIMLGNPQQLLKASNIESIKKGTKEREVMNTFIMTPTGEEMVLKCIETIKKNTPVKHYIYLIDQTKNGIRDEKIYENIDLYIRHYQHPNLGFSAANNIGIRLVRTPYFTLVNRDVEFVDPRWWDGIMKTFEVVDKATPDRPAVVVNPSSIRLPDWSVAKDNPEKNGEEVISRKLGEHCDILPYKDFTSEDYDKLLNESHYVHQNFSVEPNTVLDGITMYCSVCHTERFKKIGLLDERFYPGAGEDYDYSCRAGMRGFRTMGTTYAYVWHWWGKSLSCIGKEGHPPLWRESWNSLREKWDKDGFSHDIYGIRCIKQVDGQDCGEVLRTTDNKIATCPIHSDIKYEIPLIKEY